MPINLFPRRQKFHDAVLEKFDEGIRQLRRIANQLETLTMATMPELTASLNALTTQVGKIKDEVQKLIDALAAGGVTTPEVDAAVASLQAALQGVDDLNADQP